MLEGDVSTVWNDDMIGLDEGEYKTVFFSKENKENAKWIFCLRNKCQLILRFSRIPGHI